MADRSIKEKWLEPRVLLTLPLLVEFVLGVALSFAGVGDVRKVMAGTIGVMLFTAYLVVTLSNIGARAAKVKWTAPGGVGAEVSVGEEEEKPQDDQQEIVGLPYE